MELRNKQIVLINDKLYLTGIIYNDDLITLLKIEGIAKDLEKLIREKIDNGEFVHSSIMDKY